MRWELGGMPSHTNQHYISAGLFLGGFLFNRRLPSLSPGLPQAGAFSFLTIACHKIEANSAKYLCFLPMRVPTLRGLCGGGAAGLLEIAFNS